jgi:DNA repair exonuclease SbcCD ATPase subunit
VKIIRLDIQAFGCLKDFSPEIAPGLHIFHGPNESGKSTLQRATLALLYGFYEGDRSRPAENATRQRYTPWSDIRYAAQLEYELENRERYRVERDFSSPDVPTILRDMVTGKDVTDKFGRGRHGNVEFMRRQVGMTRRVFEACAFVSQGELFQTAGAGPDTAQEIGETIVRLADTGGRDISAKSAIARLKIVLGAQVGPGATARTKPLYVARGKLGAAKRELAELGRARSEAAADAEALEGAKRDTERLRNAFTRSRYLLTQADNRELKARLQRLQEIEEDATRLQSQIEVNHAFAAFPADERDAVLESWGKLTDLKERIEGWRVEMEKRRQRIADLSAQREELAKREMELAHLRSFPSDKKLDADGLFRSWRSAEAVNREAQRRLEHAESGALWVLDEHARLEVDVGHLAASDVHALTERLRAPSPAAGSNARTNLIRRTLKALVTALGRVLRAILRRAAPPAQVRTVDETMAEAPFDAISPDDAAAKLQKHRRYLEIAPDVRKHREEVESAQRARTALDAAAERLREMLADLVDDPSDLEAAYATFQERCARRNELESIIRRLESLDREAESVREVIGRSDEDDDRLRRLEARLRAQLEAAAGRSGSLEELVDAFEKGHAQWQLYQDAKKALQAVEGRRGIVLEGRSPAELEEMVKKGERETAGLLRETPSLSGAETNQTRDGLQELLSQQSTELSELNAKARGLSTAIEMRMRALRSRAEVEEEIEHSSQEVAQLDSFGRALDVAIDVIEKAMTEAHRDFAPSVGRFLAHGLARVTEGRYQEAYLDPETLRVTTTVPETGRMEGVDKLSQGTRAAAYLLLRAGLAQHMSAMKEPVPLILDDPLVDLDDVRLELFLEHLLGLSDAPQILLFTKDEATRVWFERNCAGNSMHKLTLLQRQPSLARVLA